MTKPVPPLLTTSILASGFLDKMRRTVDPEADSLIGEIFAGGQVNVINDMLASLDENSEAVPFQMPGHVAAYLVQTSLLPPWADREKILCAQNLFVRHGPLFGLVLMLRSLPILYAGSFGGA